MGGPVGSKTRAEMDRYGGIPGQPTFEEEWDPEAGCYEVPNPKSMGDWKCISKCADGSGGGWKFVFRFCCFFLTSSHSDLTTACH